jgi:hypothetical protein
MSNISLGNLSHQLNDLFCEPPLSTITVEKFTEAFQVDSPQSAAFLDYAQNLPLDRLCHLVTFITGKARLPLTVLGEDRMRVSFSGTTSELPMAQNCTHMLILPVLPVSVQRYKNFLRYISMIMEPIFRFDTVYGFA